jgi:protocatechuate 3,4-dioxygenase beta subunit
VQVDIWHCDAVGVYSGVADPGFDTTGRTFLRGYQVTGGDGVATFETVYPGWYPQRAVHIHFKLRAPDGPGRAREFTSQVYFDETLTDMVHAGAPYRGRPGSRRRNQADGIFQRQGGAQLVMPVAAAPSGYVGTFSVGLQV